MKLTNNRIGAILRRHQDLMEHVDSFISEKRGGGRYHSESRVSGDVIEKYVNTACHCHPEMEWVEVGTMEEFVKWLETKQQ